jgi:tight adherence protein C
MDLVILAVLIGALVFVVVLALAYSGVGRSPNLEARVQQRSEGRPGFEWSNVVRRAENVFRPLGEMVPRSPDEMSRQERRLVQGGIRRKDAPVLLYGVKIGVAIGLLILFALTRYLESNPFLFVVLAIFLGALLPDLWLTRRMVHRKERIQLALPDMLDLAVVCVEAGLGLDQSLMRIGHEIRYSHPDLSDELRLLTLEVNAGKSRIEALRNLASRTGVDDLKSLVAVLIQTDRFGTSIAQSLRVSSDSLRTKRRQRAEERAAKMNVKMIPPLVFFILPALFVIVLGPAVIAVIRELLPALEGR